MKSGARPAGPGPLVDSFPFCFADREVEEEVCAPAKAAKNKNARVQAVGAVFILENSMKSTTI